MALTLLLGTPGGGAAGLAAGRWERLFRERPAGRRLEQLMLLPVPLPAVVLAKVLAHWR
ncbi:heme exporter protein CcmB [Salmonella enterica]|uniref:heme exporter protein CcmB n=1 Tax=Salmonella enterica TaxID=28901 RepID=UPI003AFA598B